MSGNPILFSTKSVQVVLSLSKHVYKCTSCGTRCCTVNKMIISLFLYPFTLSIPFPPTRFWNFSLTFLGFISLLYIPPFQSKFLLVFKLNVQSKFILSNQNSCWSSWWTSNPSSSFPIKILVGLHDERPIQVSIKLPVKVPI